MLEPLNDRLIVQAIEDPEMTAGGVVLPDNAKEKPQRGTVIALGPDAAVSVGARRISGEQAEALHTTFDPDDSNPKLAEFLQGIVGDSAPPLAVGDTIIFSKYGGAEITLEAVDYMVLRTNDVLARIEIAAVADE